MRKNLSSRGSGLSRRSSNLRRLVPHEGSRRARALRAACTRRNRAPWLGLLGAAFGEEAAR